MPPKQNKNQQSKISCYLHILNNATKPENMKMVKTSPPKPVNSHVLGQCCFPGVLEGTGYKRAAVHWDEAAQWLCHPHAAQPLTTIRKRNSSISWHCLCFSKSWKSSCVPPAKERADKPLHNPSAGAVSAASTKCKMLYSKACWIMYSQLHPKSFSYTTNFLFESSASPAPALNWQCAALQHTA